MFITMLITSSFIVSTFGMMAALALFGPTNGKGDFQLFPAKLKPQVASPAKVADVPAAVEST